MNNRRQALLWATAVATGGVARAQDSTAAAADFAAADWAAAQRLVDAGLADTRAWALLQQLCTQVGARPAGSAADAKAVAWAQAALQDLGLKNVRAEPLGMRAWVRGPASARLLGSADSLAGSSKDELLDMLALGNSVATPPEGIEAEVAWYPSLAALTADSSDRARGRIVFVDTKMERYADGRGYGPAVGARINGAVEAAKKGALALGIRSVGTNRERVAHTGAMRYEIGVPRIPAFAVSVPDAERLAERFAELTVERSAALQAQPLGQTVAQTVPQPLRMKLHLQAQSDVDAVTHNVIAEVPGSDLAHEIVLISAHLDSWDIGQGAADDGAGVAIVSAAAALLQELGLRPRRTVRVVLFGNEENGFDGARAYGDRYGQVPHQWVGESDFGAGRVWRVNCRVQAAALPLVQRMAQLLAQQGVAWPTEGVNTGTPGPDAAVLMRRHRWPALQLSQDGTHYFDVHHTANDTLARIDPATLPQNVACWAATAWLAAQAPLSFGPLPG